MLRLVNVSKSYTKGKWLQQPVPAVDQVSLTVEAGGITGLVGASGSGKSTLARLMLGLERPDSGQVVGLPGGDIWQMDKQRFRQFRRQVQMVPQHPDAAFNPKLTVASSIAEVFYFFQICPKSRQTDMLHAMLDRLQLHPDCLQRYPHQLSGGEIQRLALARALLPGPRLVVCDEITSMLDVSVQAHIVRLLEQLQSGGGTGFLMITHNLPLARRVCRRLYSMADGRLAQLDHAGIASGVDAARRSC